MGWIRPELLKGFGVLGIFFVIIVGSSIFLPYPIAHSRYTFIGIPTIKQNPGMFEGQDVSSRGIVTSVISQGTFSIVEISEEVVLLYPSSIEPPVQGDRILFRGTSWIQENNSVHIHESYTLDYTSSIIRSIPGIIIFIVLFFSFFTIDFGHLAFVKRRNSDA